MAAIGVRMEDVKEAMSGAAASQQTVTALQILLGFETGPKSGTKPGVTSRKDTASGTSKTAKTSRTAAPRGKKVPPVDIAEDSPKPLSPREKYALATETVNSGLRILTEAAKTPKKLSEPQTKDAPSTPPSRGALQPRSSNITPKRASPEKAKSRDGETDATPSNVRTGVPSHVHATAECTRMAFAFLRSADTQKLGVREIPKLQLETGMIALIGKLFSLDLESMAIKELRHVKRRLEASYGTKKDSKPTAAKGRTTARQAERETVASLLQLEVDLGDDGQALNLAVTYCMHVFKVISLSHKPTVIEEAAQYIAFEHKNSAIELLQSLATLEGQTAKAAKQMEAVAQTILSLCPSNSNSNDVAATDLSRNASPEAVLKLQTTAIRVRKCWWTIANHRADLENELLEPFLRCALAFARRASDTLSPKCVYKHLLDAFDSLSILPEDGRKTSTLHNIHVLLSQQAEQAEMLQEALALADCIADDCRQLEMQHARRVSAAVRRTSLLMRTSNGDLDSLDLSTTAESLSAKLTGSAADFDALLASLHGLTTASLDTASSGSMHASLRQVIVLAAGFALRYARLYQGRGTSHGKGILDAALRHSRSTEDLLSWMTPHAASVHIHAGTLKTVAQVAGKRPLAEAWEASHDVVCFSRICRALILSRVRSSGSSGSSGLIDSTNLPPGERGALLELQLESVIQLTPKTKYHPVLRTLLSEILPGLDEAYNFDEYPIRRARVGVKVLRLRESCSELLSPEIIPRWPNDVAPEIDEQALGSDASLKPYLEDLKASIALSRAFSKSNPSSEQLKPALLTWSRIVARCRGAEELRRRVEDVAVLAQQLRMVAVHFAMRGEDNSRLPILRILDRIERLCANSRGDSGPSAAIDLANCYLELGYAERAGEVLAQARSSSSDGLEGLQYNLADAGFRLANEKLGDCERVLTQCKTLREALGPDAIGKDQRRAYESLHAQAWLTHSKYALESGSPHEALTAAKRSVKILSSMWAALERAHGVRKSNDVDKIHEAEASDSGVSDLTKGVSKLQLTSKDDAANQQEERNDKGAAFWPLVPILAKALMHLSDMYSHHGLFSEANYYSERAIGIAESVGSQALLSRIRSHRAQLLTLAGLLEEAELCLTRGEATVLQEPSLAAVERCCARASVRVKEGSVDEGIALLEKARRMMDEMSADGFLQLMERFEEGDGLTEKAARLSLQGGKEQRAAVRPTSAPVKKPAARARQTKPAPSNTRKPAAATSLARESAVLVKQSKIKANILLRSITLKLQLEQDVENELQELLAIAASASLGVQKKIVEHLQLVAQANAAIETDVTLNVLAESTLAFCPFVRPQSPSSAESNSDSASSKTTTRKAPAKSRKQTAKPKTGPANNVATLLQAAIDCLIEIISIGSQQSSTAQAHSEYSKLMNTSMLLSAVSDQRAGKPTHASQQALIVDQPRIKALQCEQDAVNADKSASETGEPLSWPVPDEKSRESTLVASEFQKDYIDIIPKSWTALSLCLDEDASELYIARYRSGQEPLILRLPFSRHKPEDVDEEAFDYAKGKAELQEIIELSNYTCHSSRNMDAKGAKNTWWSDREALDRRMHELLINMENIWLGGFKSVLARCQRDEDALVRFRRALEEILERYLPSRQAAKGKASRLALDDKVLELFVGLGHDQDGVIDLDEPLADLLYFVVDMLQFSGERNAYDEIDFDSMAVDVLDALRSYHETTESEPLKDQHLILVLDRRLQAFPWENMPCLQGESVSRVGSMQSLRECIVAMKSNPNQSSGNNQNATEDPYIITRTHGTYILNPSSDLTGTQTLLGPSLSSLKDSSTNEPWPSLINEAPSEQRFSTALETSNLLLYFGHGAGSQYIRPRKIKQLDRCSEVVWLMGCSSGAVTENGELEATAVPHAYLLAGSRDSGTQDTGDAQEGSKCLSVVATLWDVTDKDIDRFSLSVGAEWGLWPSTDSSKLPTKTPKKRQPRQVVAPSTPQQAPKTPKTPKVHKTPAAAGAKTPAMKGRSADCDGRGDGKKCSLVEAVARSREACYLRYLNGAAAVVYGVPVYLGD